MGNFLSNNDEVEIDTKNLPNPASGPGKWIPREDFEGNKSFGYFKCRKCSKWWLSAHSFKKFKQGCQKCETENLPVYLWKNTGTNVNENPKKDGDGVHDKQRCEACKNGLCIEY